MRTTFNIDGKLLAEAEAVLGEKSPSKVVNVALRELVRRRKVEELIALAGTVELEDNWREVEEMEMEEAESMLQD